ncbi:MAG: hypothetical protein D6725_14665 [Planctomycetota bacterium]|nr:MAG: hypothetical protein D6725_14665 [Planctomycetota bacterium]
MVDRARWGAVVGVTLAGLTFLWWAAVPLGVPGEWTWQRVPLASPAARLDAFFGAAIATVCGAVLLWAVFLAARRVEAAGTGERAGWLVALSVLAACWALAAQDAPPEGYDLAKWPRVQFYPASSGYFHLVRYEADDACGFWPAYERRVRDGEVLHLGTHPPGLFVLYEATLRTLRRLPWVAEQLVAAEPESIRAAAAIIREHAARDGLAFDVVDEAALFAVALATLASWALAMPAIYSLAAPWCGARWAMLAAGGWAFVPAPLIFMPKSDVLFAGLAVAALAVWMHALRTRSVVGVAVASLLFWFGMTMSLVFLPVGLIAALAPVLSTAFGMIRSRGTGDSRAKRPVCRERAGAGGGSSESSGCGWIAIAYAIGVSVFVVAVLVVGLAWGINLPKLWWLNGQNHAGFYERYPRSYWKWVLVNPLEASLAIGPVLVFLIAWASVTLLRGVVGRSADDAIGVDGHHCESGKAEPAGAAFAALAVWCSLWLSGKNSGEAARLWIPLFACATPLSAIGFANWAMHGAGPQAARNGAARPVDRTAADRLSAAMALLALQAVYGLLVVIRVHGFHYP